MSVVVALLLVALGMGVDAFYQHKIRVAECDAYETGYEQGQKEEKIRLDAKNPDYVFDPALPERKPWQMPETAAEHLRRHGRVTMKVVR